MLLNFERTLVVHTVQAASFYFDERQESLGRLNTRSSLKVEILVSIYFSKLLDLQAQWNTLKVESPGSCART